MSRDKQINEMAKELCHAPFCHIKDEPTECYHGCRAYLYAKRSIDKGYAKASEVAREIFEEIETSLLMPVFKGSEVYYAIREEDYLHYKKKYTEDGE